MRWDVDYDEPTMRALPEGPGVVVVKAQMGAGKTKALRDLCDSRSDASVLLVTFSRALAAKLVEDFAGFADYSAAQGQLDADRVVVCLDSLHRISKDAFDFVVVDEAVSVFLHFNSPLMSRAADNVSKLDALGKACGTLFLVDAAVDTPFVGRIVRHFCEARGCVAMCVRNRFVRPTNRRLAIYEKPRGRAAHDVICAAVRGGDRVVVCSSTKSFVIELEEHAALRCPLAKVVTHYGTSSKKAKGAAFDEPLKDVDKLWREADLLIYSPSVSAGVSFERLHFDRLYANFAASPWTPTVNVSLQQLFRVRQLRDGAMTVFFSKFGMPRDASPRRSVDSAAFKGLHPKLKGSVDHRTPLGRLVAQGVLDVKHDSDTRYLEVHVDTLRRDHGVAC